MGVPPEEALRRGLDRVRALQQQQPESRPRRRIRRSSGDQCAVTAAVAERGGGTGLVALDERVAFALRIQLLEWRAELATGAERVGWKIGRGIVEGEEHLEPVLGHLTSATRLQPGAVFPAKAAHDLRADAELAVQIGDDGEPARFGAALELVDVARPPHDFESIVAGNVWHRAFALGPLRPEPPPEFVRAHVLINGEVADSGEQRVDPGDTARIARELLGAAGERLEPGDYIIAGSLVQVPVAAGDRVAADLGELGQIDVRVG
jgi:2-keto-4-pentenoate hydratase